MGGCKIGITGSQIWLYDGTLNKIIKSNVKNIIKNNTFYPSKEYKLKNFYSSIAFIDSLNFCGIGAFGSSSKSKIDIVNLISNDVLNKYGEYQIPTDKLKLETIRDIHTSVIYSHPTQKKIVLGYRYSDIIEIYNLETEECITIHGPEKYDVNFKQEKTSGYFYMGKNKETKKAFINGTVTNQYIYLVYSGHQRENRSEEDRYKWSYGKYVYIYDWNGNPIKRLDLDRHIYTLGVSKNDKNLYSFDINTGYLIEAKIN
ncbi:hypothetical protein JL193_08240 [Polaribacter batillariae]|uniref:Uncharacterized protein n=1 Tax=Polaribacter batillariae TaxID=2808900 RepID=A0ABX7T1G0_9FLAO|nr:hypothetical protein JL193_08240 [Polaribacter batillariae]